MTRADRKPTTAALYHGGPTCCVTMVLGSDAVRVDIETLAVTAFGWRYAGVETCTDVTAELTAGEISACTAAAKTVLEASV